jgi:flavin-dependent dehydrogenase
MVDSNWGSGIGHGIKGGELAGKIAVRALEENKFNEAFLGQFEKEWKSGSSYKSIRRSQMLMKLALNYSKLDKKAFLRLYRLFIKKQGAHKV